MVIRRQVDELYGPLLGLVQQSRIAYEVAAGLLPTDSTGGWLDPTQFSGDDPETWRFL